MRHLIFKIVIMIVSMLALASCGGKGTLKDTSLFTLGQQTTSCIDGTLNNPQCISDLGSLTFIERIRQQIQAQMAADPNNLPLITAPSQPNANQSDTRWVTLTNTQLYPDQGLSQNEVIQGVANDCTVFAALSSIVAQDPTFIKTMITLVGKTADDAKIYSVALFDPKTEKQQYIRVDEKILQDANGQTPYAPIYEDPTSKSVILWPLIIQKAIAVYYGSYENIARSAAANIPIITASKTQSFSPRYASIDEFSLRLQGIVNKGFVTTSDAYVKDNQSNITPGLTIFTNGDYNCVEENSLTYCMAQAHEYTVLAFDGRTVTIRNPWGKNLGDGTESNGIVHIPVLSYAALTSHVYFEENQMLSVHF